MTARTVSGQHQVLIRAAVSADPVSSCFFENDREIKRANLHALHQGVKSKITFKILNNKARGQAASGKCYPPLLTPPKIVRQVLLHKQDCQTQWNLERKALRVGEQGISHQQRLQPTREDSTVLSMCCRGLQVHKSTSCREMSVNLAQTPVHQKQVKHQLFHKATGLEKCEPSNQGNKSARSEIFNLPQLTA